MKASPVVVEGRVSRDWLDFVDRKELLVLQVYRVQG
jgi:hypothetical protein